MEPGTIVNVHSDAVRFEIATAAGSPPFKFKLPPGGTAEIPAGYTVRPEAAPGAQQAPSAIEMLTNGHVLPADDPRASRFVKTLEPESDIVGLDGRVASARSRKG